MAPTNRRRFERHLGERRYKRLFIIASEGSVTEREYFDLFNSDQAVVKVRCLKGTCKTSPRQVLANLARFLRGQSMRGPDEAWVVVDKDQWNDSDLRVLHAWSKKKTNYGLAVSNSKFEFWLVLHFWDAGGISTSRHCDERMKKTFPKYDKHIEPNRFTRTSIEEALRRAKALDSPKCTDWPKGPGTTVYRLVEKILG